MSVDKHAIRKARLAILSEIDRLDTGRCVECRPSEGESQINKTHCMCGSAVKIRKLGLKLDMLISRRKPKKVVEPVKPVVAKIDTKKFETLTVEQYKEYKDKKMGDREIVKIYRVSTARLGQWKKDMGLRQYGIKVGGETLTGEQLLAMEQLGLSIKTVRQRVASYGWTLEEAISIKALTDSESGKRSHGIKKKKGMTV